MNRVFINFGIEQLRSDNRCRNMMYYLQIRCKTRNHSGWFTEKLFASTIGLIPRTAKKHLKNLIDAGFVNKPNNGAYRIVSQKNLFNAHKIDKCYMMSDEQIMSFSWKNIASFRSIITELEVQRYKNHQKVKERGYTKIDQRSKASDKVKKDVSIKPWHNLVSLSLAGILGNFSGETARRYRKRQTLSTYTWDGFTIYSEDKTKTKESSGKELELKTGEHKFEFFNRVIVSPCSVRVSEIRFKRR